MKKIKARYQQFKRLIFILIFTVNQSILGNFCFAVQQDIRYIPIAQVGHTGTVEVVAISDDQQFMVTGGRDAFITLWSLEQKHILKRFVLEESRPQQLLFHPDGRRFIALIGGTVSIFDVMSSRVVHPPVNEPIQAIAVNARNQLVMVGEGVYTWDFTGQTLSQHYQFGRLDTKPKKSEFNFSAIALPANAQLLARRNSNGLIELWDPKSGKVKQRIDMTGSIKNMAFSTDLAFFATAPRQKSARLFDLSGKEWYPNQLRHEVDLTSVAFSPNNKFLATADRRGTIKIWRLSDGKQVEQFKDTNSVIFLLFYPDNQGLLSTGRDQSIRHYYLAHLNNKAAPRRPSRPFQPFTSKESLMAVAAKANIAVTLGRNSGYSNHLRTWDLSHGKLTKNFELTPRWGRMTALNVAANGKSVIYGTKEGIVNIKLLNYGTTPCHSLMQVKESDDFLCHSPKGPGVAIAQHKGLIHDVDISTTKRLAVSTGDDGVVKTWNLDTFKQHQSYHFKRPAIRAVFVPGHEQIAVLLGQHFPGDSLSDKLVLLDLEKNSTTMLPVKQGYELLLDSLGEQLVVVTHESFYLYHWPTQRLIERKFSGENRRGVAALTADGKQLVLGGQLPQGLVVIDLESGKKLHDFDSYRAVVDSLGISSTTGLLTVSSEGMLKVFDINEGSLRAQISGTLDSEWVVTTPDGFYNSSLDGARNVLIVPKDKNIGYSVDQFAAVLKRPDIIKTRLSAATPKRVETGLTDYIVPTVEIKNRHQAQTTSNKFYSLTMQVSDDADKIMVYVNGKLSLTQSVSGGRLVKLKVPLRSQYNRISAVAYHRKTSSAADHVSVESHHRDFNKPKLHVLSVGINNYGGVDNLDLAVADAKMIPTVFKAGKDAFYAQVSSTLLVDEQASSQNILAALQQLRTVSANDVVIVYLAGHGVVRDGEFFFKTIGDKNAGIAWSTMVQVLNDFSATTLVILDACHSGAAANLKSVDSQSLVSGLVSGKQSGLMVFSASKGRQQAHENASQSNSIFNEAIVKGLTSMAAVVDVDNNGLVGLKELVAYVTEQVMQKTQKEQTPWLANQQFFDDMPLMKYR